MYVCSVKCEECVYVFLCFLTGMQCACGACVHVCMCACRSTVCGGWWMVMGSNHI